MSDTQFTVVHSDDGRISLWPVTREIPWGWQGTGVFGPHEACLKHIEQTGDHSTTEPADQDLPL